MNKRILTVCLAVVALLSAVSCKKDKEELIVGKWQISTEDGYTKETVFNHYIPEPVVNMQSWGFVFHADGNGLLYETVDGSELERNPLTYTIDGDDIYLLYSNGVRIRWTIEKIGDKSLSLSSRYELTNTGGDRRYGYGSWKFDRMEYTAPVPTVDTVAPADTIPVSDSLAGQDTTTGSEKSKFFANKHQ